jgi:hypothetical protein
MAKRGQSIGSTGLQGWVDFSGVWEKKPRKRVKGMPRIGTKDRAKKLAQVRVDEATKILQKKFEEFKKQKVNLDTDAKMPEGTLILSGAVPIKGRDPLEEYGSITK